MSWVWAIGAVWLLLGGLLGVLIGRGVHLADRRQAEADAVDAPNFVVDPTGLSPRLGDPIPHPAAQPAVEHLPAPRKSRGA
jgi:hypothetical protein